MSLLVACGGDSEPVSGGVLDWRALEAPGDSDGQFPVWAAGSDAALLWTEGHPHARRLMWSALDPDGAWSAPATVASGPDWVVHWVDTPAGASAGPQAGASWLVEDGQGGVSVALSRSMDGGFSWGEPLALHAARPGVEHGFVSLVPEEGGFTAYWLDGRTGQAALLARRFAGRPGSEVVLDPRVCDCCPTAAVELEDGSTLVVYRDRSEGEVRDIAWVRGRLDPDTGQARFDEPHPVRVDGWRIEGCPVNGPALARHEGNVSVAWFTAAGDQPRVFVASSPEGALDFGHVERIDEGKPMGRVALVGFAGGLIAAWLEDVPDQGARWCVRLRDSEGWGEAGLLSGLGDGIGRLQLRPSLDGGGALGAWSDGEGVHVARLGPPR